jgi:phage-related minor tail protein
MARNSNVTTSFSVDLADFKRNLQQATNQIRQANADFDLAAASMDDWESSTNGLEAKIQQLEATIRQQNNQVSLYQRAIQELTQNIEENQRKEAALVQQYEEAKRVYGENSNEAKALQRELNQLRTSIRNEENQITSFNLAMTQTQTQAARNERSLQDYRGSLNDLRSGLTSTASSVADTNDELEESEEALDGANEGWSVFGGMIANIGAELATKAIEGITSAIGALKDSIVDFSSEYDKTMNKFQAQTGATAEEMEKYKDVIENVYGDNFGESLEDVGASVATISQMMPEIAIDDESLKKVTEDAYVLKDTFDFDINESVRSAKMLMDQFGITSDEAFNLMAQGAQNGLNKNGDLMDVINEYSVHYKQMGYSAEEFFNSLSNGAAAGAFSVDKVGDAMKEFGIRTKDTSTATQDAFKALGFAGAVTLDTEKITKTQEEIEKLEKNLKYAKMEQEGFNDKTKELTKTKNADKIADYTEQLEEAKARLEALTTVTETSGTSIEELQAQFFAGGESAKAATKEIIDRLMNMDDEVQRNAIGVGLFGEKLTI